MNGLIWDTTTEAALLQYGFGVGYFSRADIEHWAERQIELVDVAAIDIIELAILRHKNDYDIMALLARIGKDVPSQSRARFALGGIGRAYRAGMVSLDVAIRTLFAMLHDGTFTVAERETRGVCDLDYAYDLAVEQVWGTLEEVKTQFLAFTEPYVAAVVEGETKIRGQRDMTR